MQDLNDLKLALLTSLVFSGLHYSQDFKIETLKSGDVDGRDVFWQPWIKLDWIQYFFWLLVMPDLKKQINVE